MTDNENHPGYFAIIPANVRYDSSLNPNAKLLYGELTALSKKNGYCWAKNKYFAELYGVSECSISKWLQRLKAAGYIRIVYKYAPGTREIEERHIILSLALRESTPHPPDAGETPEGGIHFYTTPCPETSENPEPTGLSEEPDTANRPLNLECTRGNDALDTACGHCQAKNKDFAGLEEQSHAPQDAGESGGVVNFYNTSCKKVQHVVENFTTGGVKKFKENNTPLNKTSAAADPETSETGPPEKPAAAADLIKQEFKKINGGLIFDQGFYRKAAVFLETSGLDTVYLSWLYALCVQKQPRNITGYYYAVFFEQRFVELYREELRSRPPPAPPFMCPVCGAEHQAYQNCPNCGLEKDRRDPREVERAKKLRAMPENTRLAYEQELELFLKNCSQYGFLEKQQLLHTIRHTYGLEDEPT